MDLLEMCGDASNCRVKIAIFIILSFFLLLLFAGALQSLAFSLDLGHDVVLSLLLVSAELTFLGC